MHSKNIISEILTPVCSAVHDKRSAALLDIQTTTYAVDHLTSESTRMLKAIGSCSYDTESDLTASEHSPGFYGSDIDPWNYDSSSLGGRL